MVTTRTAILKAVVYGRAIRLLQSGITFRYMKDEGWLQHDGHCFIFVRDDSVLPHFKTADKRNYKWEVLP